MQSYIEKNRFGGENAQRIDVSEAVTAHGADNIVKSNFPASISKPVLIFSSFTKENCGFNILYTVLYRSTYCFGHMLDRFRKGGRKIKIVLKLCSNDIQSICNHLNQLSACCCVSSVIHMARVNRVLVPISNIGRNAAFPLLVGSENFEIK